MASKRRQTVQITKEGHHLREEEEEERSGGRGGAEQAAIQPVEATSEVMRTRRIAPLRRRRNGDAETKGQGEALVERLMKVRGLNLSFVASISQQVGENELLDLTEVCRSYIRHMGDTSHAETVDPRVEEQASRNPFAALAQGQSEPKNPFASLQETASGDVATNSIAPKLAGNGFNAEAAPYLPKSGSEAAPRPDSEAGTDAASTKPTFSFSTPATAPSNEASGTPAFTFGQKAAASTAAVSLGKPAANDKPATSTAHFQFGRQSKPNVSAEETSAPAKETSAPDAKQNSSSKQTDAATPRFNFGEPADKTPTPAFQFGSKAAESTPTFGFGSKAAESTPTFGFGSKAAESTPTFSFGSKPANESQPASETNAAFGKDAPTNGPTKTKEDEHTKKAEAEPPYKFGQPSGGFTFGTQTSDAGTTQPAAFSFGSGPKEVPTSAFQFGMQSNDKKDEAQDATKQSATSPGNFTWSADRGIKFDTPPSFGNPVSTPASAFGNPLSTPSASPFGSKPAFPSAGVGFSFGTPSVDSKLDNSEGVADGDGTGGEEDDVHDKADKVDLASGRAGEEDETTLFSTRAKVLERQEDGRFEVLGLGTLRLNQRKDDVSRIRILLRAEGSGRVVFNVAVHKELEYPTSGKKDVLVRELGDRVKTYFVRSNESKGLADALAACT